MDSHVLALTNGEYLHKNEEKGIFMLYGHKRFIVAGKVEMPTTKYEKCVPKIIPEILEYILAKW